MLARCTAINGRRLFLEGPPARTLRVLLHDHGIEPTMEAINQVPAGLHGPPHFVEALADVLEGGSDDGPAGPGAQDDPEVLRRRLAALKQVMANHEADVGRVPDELEKEYEQLLGDLAELDALTIG